MPTENLTMAEKSSPRAIALHIERAFSSHAGLSLSLCFSAVQWNDLRHFPSPHCTSIFKMELVKMIRIVITVVVVLLELVAHNLHLSESLG